MPLSFVISRIGSSRPRTEGFTLYQCQKQLRCNINIKCSIIYCSNIKKIAIILQSCRRTHYTAVAASAIIALRKELEEEESLPTSCTSSCAQSNSAAFTAISSEESMLDTSLTMSHNHHISQYYYHWNGNLYVFSEEPVEVASVKRSWILRQQRMRP